MRYGYHLTGLFLLIVLAFVLILTNMNRGRESDAVFNVDPKYDIDRVELEKNGKSVSITIKEGSWLVDDIYPARRDAVEFLLETLRRLEVKSPVSDDLYRTVVEEKDLTPINVRVYDSRKIVQSFIAYTVADLPGGNVMKKTKSSDPYIVHLPGFSLNPAVHFVTDEKFWRPFFIFSAERADIDFISLEYRDAGKPGIYIKADSGKFIVRLGGIIPEQVDTAAVKRYMAYFSYVPFESWETTVGKEIIDSLLITDPDFIFRVGMNNGDTTVFSGWKRPAATGSGQKFDTDRVWGNINKNSDIFVARYFDIDPILKQAGYFTGN